MRKIIVCIAVLAALPLVGCVNLSSPSSGSSYYEPTCRYNRFLSYDGLEIQSCDATFDSLRDSVTVSGKARNETKVACTAYIKITLHIAADDTIVDWGNDLFPRLQPGETWKYEVTIYHENVNPYGYYVRVHEASCD